MPIYTRTGDFGATGLGRGKRAPKNALIIHVIGEIDELNSSLAFVSSSRTIGPHVRKIQNQLFYVSAEIAGLPVKNRIIAQPDIAQCEKIIDEISNKLPPLKNFIFPGGCEEACHLFFSRAIARRLERSLVALSKKQKMRPELLMYANRLSDLLFVLARRANKLRHRTEITWRRGT